MSDRKVASSSSERSLTTSVGAVESAIRVLEDDGCLNAGVCVCVCALGQLGLRHSRSSHGWIQTRFLYSPGYGSNLTIDGEVECDASIMDGVTGAFGSVGAVEGAVRLSKKRNISRFSQSCLFSDFRSLRCV